MPDRLNKADTILRDQNASLVIIGSDGEYYIGTRRGVADMYMVFSERPEFLVGAAIADKVVGKGAAALMVLGRILALRTAVISKSAYTLLNNAGIHVEAASVVDNIINRAGTGICPVEALTANCVTADECLPKIRNFLAK